MPEATEGNNLCPCEHRSGHPWPRLLVPDAVYLVRPCTRLTVYMHAFVASHFLVLSRHKHIPVQKKGEPKLPSFTVQILYKRLVFFPQLVALYLAGGGLG